MARDTLGMEFEVHDHILRTQYTTRGPNVPFIMHTMQSTIIGVKKNESREDVETSATHYK